MGFSNSLILTDEDWHLLATVSASELTGVATGLISAYRNTPYGNSANPELNQWIDLPGGFSRFYLTQKNPLAGVRIVRSVIGDLDGYQTLIGLDGFEANAWPPPMMRMTLR